MVKKKVIQKHHIKYDPEETVMIYKGEHWVITLLNRHTRNVSKGMIECLKRYIEEYEDDCDDLEIKKKEEDKATSNENLRL